MKIKKINKRGVSVMIGYILLISIAIVMGVIVYQTLKTYVPSDIPDCPDDTSVFIQSYSCDNTWLNISIKNNGKFDVGGFFIHVSNELGQEIATQDISQYIHSGGISAGGAIIYGSSSNNGLAPGEIIKSSFKLGQAINLGNIYLLEIIPTRYQEINNQLNFVSCGKSKIREAINDSSCSFIYNPPGGA